MIKNKNRNSRDDKSKTGKTSTSRRPKTTTEDKPKNRFGDKEEKEVKRKSNFATGEKTYKDFKPRSSKDNDSKPSPGKDFKPRPEGAQKGGFKPWEKKESGNSSYKPKAYKEGSSKDSAEGEKRSYIKKENKYSGEGGNARFDDKKTSTSRSTDSRPFRKKEYKDFKQDRGERIAPATRGRKIAEPKDDGLIRLNRYIANAGVCSRRKADELIEAGIISVNGVPVLELGHKVDPYKDEVRYNGELLKREKKIYVLLNKPKDYITTTEDPQERRTVMHLVEKASKERIYPVGRLDRNTTGLLLMTNDGELADKLSHPKNGITKIYHVELSKNLSQGDFNKIQFGLELEDGLIKPDNISYVAGASKREVGIQIHSGKNRIVRRIFEHLGYDVVKLDRVVYGNLTKKDLPRGKWRFLEDHELIQIKHLIK